MSMHITPEYVRPFVCSTQNFKIQLIYRFRDLRFHLSASRWPRARPSRWRGWGLNTTRKHVRQARGMQGDTAQREINCTYRRFPAR